MKSLTTPDFWQLYIDLPPKIKKQARKSYQLWIENQSHPSLHFKKISGNLWSVRVSRNYRALALKIDEDFSWFWIGSHDEYEELLKS
jgi:hypothetical protein